MGLIYKKTNKRITERTKYIQKFFNRLQKNKNICCLQFVVDFLSLKDEVLFEKKKKEYVNIKEKA